MARRRYSRRRRGYRIIRARSARRKRGGYSL